MIKILSCLLVLAGLLMSAGCSTPHSVAKMKGLGEKRAFDVGYDPVWNAVKAVAVMDDLHVLNADESTGCILARHGMDQQTFGDNVAIWIRQISPTRTEVEVISRRVGPPVPFTPNHEHAILRNIAKVLSSSA